MWWYVGLLQLGRQHRSVGRADQHFAALVGGTLQSCLLLHLPTSNIEWSTCDGGWDYIWLVEWVGMSKLQVLECGGCLSGYVKVEHYLLTPSEG